MVGCVRMGWREPKEVSYISGGGNVKMRRLVYNLEKHEVMDRLLKAYARGDRQIVPQDLIDLEANALREDKLFHLYGQGVRTKLVKSDDPRDKGPVRRQDDLQKAVKDLEEILGDTCPKHGKTLSASGRCSVCGLGYRIFDR